MVFTTNPGYLDLITQLPQSYEWLCANDSWQKHNFYEEFTKYYKFELIDYGYIVLIAIVITAIRYVFNIYFCDPLLKKLKLNPKTNERKFRESSWKLTAYTIFWSYCSYLLLFSGRHNYFYEPWLIWDDWKLHMDIPFDITILYFVECGFYLHSLYATIFMDILQKDFMVMILHHVLTMTLVIVSYGTRYHKIGILVLFVHDITDIWLEFTKINVYLKNRDKKFYIFFEYVSNIGFVLFAVSWFVFRLYWFPLKVLYTTVVVCIDRAYPRGAGLYGFFNILLLLLLILDIYWFYFIALFLYKIATGQLKELNDTRDYENKINGENKSKKKN